LPAASRSIRAADLGFNPLNDGKTIKVPIPPLDDERRREMAKKIKKMLEDEKTALRNMRRECKEQIEQLEKDKKITEDDKFNGLELLLFRPFSSASFPWCRTWSGWSHPNR
jgi:ribosome recycling factor